jgi:hypothetical protein
MNEKKRARGDGRIFMRGSIAWIQYYDARGKQIRESSESPNAKKAAKLLRTQLGEVAVGVHRDPRSVTYESLRESTMLITKPTRESRCAVIRTANPILIRSHDSTLSLRDNEHLTLTRI